MPSGETRHCPVIGMKQGDKFGVWCFEMYMDQPVQRINQFIRERGWQCKCQYVVKPVLAQRAAISIEETACFDGDEFVDDAEWAITDDDALRLYENMLELVDYIVMSFRLYALEIDWGVGKSTLMIQPRGKNADVVKKRLYEATKVEDTIRVQTPGGIEVSVVRAFKRVGHWRHTDGSRHKEIQHRTAAGYTALWKIRTRLLENPSIPQQLKVIFTNALVSSRCQFGAEAWSQISMAELAAIDRPRIRAARAIAGDKKFELCRVAALQTAGFAPLQFVLRKRRMKLLPTILQNQWLCAILTATVGPLPMERQLQEDLQDLAMGLTTRQAELWDLDKEHWGKLETMIAKNPGGWKYLVGQSKQVSTDWRYLEKEEEAEREREEHDQVCDICGKENLTAMTLKLHIYMEHMEIDKYKLWVTDTSCPICGNEYHERTRALRHLKYDAPRCRREIDRRMEMEQPPMLEWEALMADMDARKSESKES